MRCTPRLRLDMPRRGVAHVRGGIGKLAEALADAVRRHGGRVHTRQAVTRVAGPRAGSYRVETGKDAVFEAETVVFNLPPHDAAALLVDDAPPKLRRAELPADGWGAFMVYVGLQDAVVSPGLPLHHQVLVAEPLGEGNSVFLSLSLPDDAATRKRRPQPGRPSRAHHQHPHRSDMPGGVCSKTTATPTKHARRR